VIVALAVGDVPAACLREQPSTERNTEAVLVFRLVDRPDHVWVASGIFLDDCRCGIGRGVVMNDHLDREIRFLPKETLQRFPDERRMVVSQADDAQQRLSLVAPGRHQFLLVSQFHTVTRSTWSSVRTAASPQAWR